MELLESVRESCRQIAAHARHVKIDLDALQAIEPAPGVGGLPDLDPRCHYLEGAPEDVADFMLALDAINFGSGWFPTLAKRKIDGRHLSGYFTIALALAEHVRAEGPPSAAWLRRIDTREIAAILGQDPAGELMSLYAQALRSLGSFLGERRALDLIEEAGGSAERLAEMLAKGMAFFDDRGFYKRAQIVANDLALAGVARFDDLDRLTIFADNLVPHVLRCDGVLRYEQSLADAIDRGEILPAGGAEREIRACALHACELIAQLAAPGMRPEKASPCAAGIPPRKLDTWLWSRGQAPAYKSRPRHRCRCVYY